MVIDMTLAKQQTVLDPLSRTRQVLRSSKNSPAIFDSTGVGNILP